MSLTLRPLLPRGRISTVALIGSVGVPRVAPAADGWPKATDSPAQNAPKEPVPYMRSFFLRFLGSYHSTAELRTISWRLRRKMVGGFLNGTVSSCPQLTDCSAPH